MVPLTFSVLALVCSGCSSNEGSKASETTASNQTSLAFREDPYLRYDSDRGAWQDQVFSFDENLGGGVSPSPFQPGQIYPTNIIRYINKGDSDFENDMLNAAQSLIDCRGDLKGLVGPPPVGPTDVDMSYEDQRTYDAYKEACVSYEAGGKLFAKGIELRDISILKVGLATVREGDRVLCAAGIGAFSCRGRKSQSP